MDSMGTPGYVELYTRKYILFILAYFDSYLISHSTFVKNSVRDRIYLRILNTWVKIYKIANTKNLHILMDENGFYCKHDQV